MLIGYIVRHGESVGNDLGIFRSALDSPLTKKGIQQAKQAAEFLKDKPIAHIVSSPLLRAFITAELISRDHDIVVYQHRALFPWSLGVLTGLSKSDNQDALDLFIDNPDVPLPSGSAVGESLNDFLDRELAFWEAALKMARIAGLTVFVCHNSVILALDQIITGRDAEIGERELIAPGGVLAIHYDGKNYSLFPVFDQNSKQQISIS